MYIIFAQGNPGASYARTRHNVGFMALDRLADELQAPAWKTHSKAAAETTEVRIAGEKVLLVKPTSFYNETGPVAQALLHYYKCELSQLLVIHDDLALPFGTVRIREKGSDAGNNGIKSLNQHLGQDYFRIRIGIANQHYAQFSDSDFVLAAFSADELTTLRNSILPLVDARCESFVRGELAHTSFSA